MSGGRLVVLDRAGRDGKRFPLAEGMATLGSDPACEIRIMLPTVSPHHATVVVHANQTVVRNVCSDDTQVNGRPVSVAALQHGDVIGIGGRQLRWEYADPARRRPQAAQPALHVARHAGRSSRARRRSAPARAAFDPALQLVREMSYRASMPGSAGGKQLAIVQPQRRDTSDQIDKNPPRSPQQANKRARTSKTDLDTSASEAEQEKTKRKSTARLSPKSSPSNLQTTTMATLWIESRKKSPRKVQSPARRSVSACRPTPLRLTVLKRAQSDSSRVTKIEGPLQMDHTKQAAIRLMTGHTPKRKPSSPSLVVKKPSPVRRTPRSRNSRATPSNTPGNSRATIDNSTYSSATLDNSRATSGNTSTRRSGVDRTVTILEITDSDERNSTLRNRSSSRRSVQKSPKKSFRSLDSTSPRNSALKDNLENNSQDSDVLMLSDKMRASHSDDDVTLRYSPSPRRSIHPRPPPASPTVPPRPPPACPTVPPWSPRSPKCSSRASFILQKALDETDTSLYSRRTTKSVSDSSRNTTVAAAFRTRTLSPRADRDLEFYSIVPTLLGSSTPYVKGRAGSQSAVRSSRSGRSKSLSTPENSEDAKKHISVNSTRISVQKSPKKSFRSLDSTSPRNSALKDNLENNSQDSDVLMLSDKMRASHSDDDVTLRYSPSPRRSIHPRPPPASPTVPPRPPPASPTVPPWSPRSPKCSSRASFILQKALDETDTSLYSRRTTKSVSDSSRNTTVAAAFRTRTLSPRADRDLEFYSIVPTLLGSSTPYVKGRAGSQSAVRSSRSGRSKSLSTPENSEDAKKHISVNSTRISVQKSPKKSFRSLDSTSPRNSALKDNLENNSQDSDVLMLSDKMRASHSDDDVTLRYSPSPRRSIHPRPPPASPTVPPRPPPASPTVPPWSPRSPKCSSRASFILQKALDETDTSLYSRRTTKSVSDSSRNTTVAAAFRTRTLSPRADRDLEFYSIVPTLLGSSTPYVKGRAGSQSAVRSSRSGRSKSLSTPENSEDAKKHISVNSTRISVQKSPKKSFRSLDSTSPRNSALKDNLENNSQDSDVLMLSDKMRASHSDDDVTLRYSPSPRRSIHPRPPPASPTVPPRPPPASPTVPPWSPRSPKCSSRASFILQKALDETDTSLYSRRTTKSVSESSRNTTVAAAFRTRTLSPRADRDLEFYSIVPTLLGSSTPYVKGRAGSQSAVRSSRSGRSKSLSTPENSEDAKKHISVNSTRISVQKSPKKSFRSLDSTSPRNSALKDNLENNSQDSDVLMLSDKMRASHSDDDVTLRYSPSPRRSIHPRPPPASPTVPPRPPPASPTVPPWSPRSPKCSSRASFILQKALDETDTSLYSRRTTKSVSDSSRNTTVAAAFRTRTLSPRADRDLEFYSIVPTLLGSSTPYVKGRAGSQSAVRSSRSGRSKSLSTPENSEDAKKHISVNSTRISVQKSPKKSFRSLDSTSPRNYALKDNLENNSQDSDVLMLSDKMRASHSDDDVTLRYSPSPRRSIHPRPPPASPTVPPWSPRSPKCSSRASFILQKALDETDTSLYSRRTTKSVSDSCRNTTVAAAFRTRTLSPRADRDLEFYSIVPTLLGSSTPYVKGRAGSQSAVRSSRSGRSKSLSTPENSEDAKKHISVNSTRISVQKSPKKSFRSLDSTSPRNSALKDNLENNSQDSDVLMLSDKMRASHSDDDVTLRYSPSPRRSIHPRPPPASPTVPPWSPRSPKCSSRASFILQKALDETDTSLYSRRTTKSVSDSCRNTTVAAAFRTRTLSPRADRDLEFYSIVPTLLGSSTPYVKGRAGSQSAVRSSRSGRSKSLSTPENSEDAKKHISVNSTRISRVSRSRSRLDDSELLLLDEDDDSPRTSKRISTMSKPGRASAQTVGDDTQLSPAHIPAQHDGTFMPENRHSPEEASTPVLSIQSLLESCQSSFASQKPTKKGRPSFNTKRKTIGGVTGAKTRVGAKSKSLSFSARKTRLKLSSESVEVLNKTDDSEIVTPKSAVKLVPEGVKNKHSTAKKPQSKRSIIDDLNESDIVKQQFNSPVKRKLSQSMTEFSRKQLFDDDDFVHKKRPTRNTIAITGRTPDNSLLDHTESYTPEIFVSPISTPTRSPSLEGIKLMFAKTTPENDLRNVRGVKRLLRTPRTRRSIKNDLTDVSGVKQIFAKSPKNRLSDVRVKEVFVSSPKNDLRRVSGVKPLFHSTNKRKSPRNELDDVRGVKKLFNTKSPSNDLRNVSGVKRTLRRQSPRNDLSDVSGVEELFNLSNYSSATVSTRAESLFDQLVGKPQIRAVYSKTFSSKTVQKTKNPRGKSLHVSLDQISAADNNWLEQELNKRLQIKNYLDSLKSANTSKVNRSKANKSKSSHASLDEVTDVDVLLDQELNKEQQINKYLESMRSVNDSKANKSKVNKSRVNKSKANISKANVSRELLKLVTETVEGDAPLRTSRVRSSTVGSSHTELHLPLKKRSLVSGRAGVALPLKKRVLPHSTPLKGGATSVTLDAKVLARVSPIHTLTDTSHDISITSTRPKETTEARPKSTRGTRANTEHVETAIVPEIVKPSPKKTRGRVKVASPTAKPTSPVKEKAVAKGRKASPEKAKVESHAKAKKESPVKTKTASPIKAKKTSPAKAKKANSAKARNASPAKAKIASPAKAKKGRPAKAKRASPAKAKKISPVKGKKAGPAKGKAASSVKKASPAKRLASPVPVKATRSRRNIVSALETNTKKCEASLVVAKKSPVMSPKPRAMRKRKEPETTTTPIVTPKKTRATRKNESVKDVKPYTLKNTRAKVLKATVVVSKPSPQLKPRATRRGRADLTEQEPTRKTRRTVAVQDKQESPKESQIQLKSSSKTKAAQVKPKRLATEVSAETKSTRNKSAVKENKGEKVSDAPVKAARGRKTAVVEPAKATKQTDQKTRARKANMENVPANQVTEKRKRQAAAEPSPVKERKTRATPGNTQPEGKPAGRGSRR